MPTNYPGALDTTTQLPNARADNTTAATNHASDHNNLSDAVRAIETELGTDPAGTFTNVAARLNARTTVRLTADSSAFTTQTLANLSGMSFPVAASQDYYFKFVIPVTMGAARGVGVAITCPASPTGIYYSGEIWGHTAADSAGTAHWTGIGTSSGDTIVNTPTAGSTTGIVVVEGILVNGVNAGTLQVQLRQGAGATAVNVVAKKGAYGELYLN